MKFLKDSYENHREELERTVRERTGPKLADFPVCDFCGTPPPKYIYAASRMSTGEIKENWRWCACETCSSLVDQENWSEVTRRIAIRLQEMAPITRRLGLFRLAASAALMEFLHYAVKVQEKDK